MNGTRVRARTLWYFAALAWFLAALNFLLATVDLFGGDTAGVGTYGYRAIACAALALGMYAVARQQVKS